MDKIKNLFLRQSYQDAWTEYRRSLEKASMIIELTNELNLANDNLIKQRNLLLPRLMSGKLEV